MLFVLASLMKPWARLSGSASPSPIRMRPNRATNVSRPDMANELQWPPPVIVDRHVIVGRTCIKETRLVVWAGRAGRRPVDRRAPEQVVAGAGPFKRRGVCEVNHDCQDRQNRELPELR